MASQEFKTINGIPLADIKAREYIQTVVSGLQETNTEVGKAKEDLNDLKEQIGQGGGTVTGGGISDTARIMLISILTECITGTDQTSAISALNEELKKASTPSTPDEPDVPTTATLESISVIYGGGSVEEGTDINILKPDIICMAYYSDGSTVAVTEYTLSGTIAVGVNTITVNYSGKTATFTVVGGAFDNFAESNIIRVSNGNDLIDIAFTRDDVTSCELTAYPKVYFVHYPNTQYGRIMNLKAFSTNASYSAAGNISQTNKIHVSNYTDGSLGIVTNAWDHFDIENSTGYVVFEIDVQKLYEKAIELKNDGTFKYLDTFRFQGYGFKSGETEKLLKQWVES